MGRAFCITHIVALYNTHAMMKLAILSLPTRVSDGSGLMFVTVFSYRLHVPRDTVH